MDVNFMFFFFVVEIIMLPLFVVRAKMKYAPQPESESIKLKKLHSSLPSKMIYFALAVETFMLRRELVREKFSKGAERSAGANEHCFISGG